MQDRGHLIQGKDLTRSKYSVGLGGGDGSAHISYHPRFDWDHVGHSTSNQEVCLANQVDIVVLLSPESSA